MNYFRGLLSLVLLVGAPWVGSTQAAEVWKGPKIIFSKPPVADWTLPANQDRITSNVWITRSISAGLFNAKTESNYVSNYSPADTEWSFGTTDDIGSLTFENWREAVYANPPASVGQDMVLHLITDDIYIDLKFLDWKGVSNGSFTYERSTPTVPEPATVGLLLLGTTLMCAIRRRRLR